MRNHHAKHAVMQALCTLSATLYLLIYAFDAAFRYCLNNVGRDSVVLRRIPARVHVSRRWDINGGFGKRAAGFLRSSISAVMLPVLAAIIAPRIRSWTLGGARMRLQPSISSGYAASYGRALRAR